MNLIFEKISSHDKNKIIEVYNIIKESGVNMYEKYGLLHWKTPYPLDIIKSNCISQEVFLVKDLDANKYVHTFHLEFQKINLSNSHVKKSKAVLLNKFSTLPEFEGKGIGKLSLRYIEKYCKSKNIHKILLDVYIESIGAIEFYKKNGFEIIDLRPTKNFKVYLMEKII